MKHTTTSTIVLYPSPGMGHLIAMVELGKLILKHQPSLSIIIFITPAPYYTGCSATPYINSVTKTTPSIIFHHLPTISLPPEYSTESPNHETLTFELIRSNNPNVHQALQTISGTSNIRTFILDCFCTVSIDVVCKLHIPTYCFFTSAAADLALCLYFPTLHKSTTKSFKDMETYLTSPGFPSIPATDMPQPMLDRSDEAYQGFLSFADSLISHPQTGILVNSFEALEPRSVKAISKGLCVPDALTPPVYYIGPLINVSDSDTACPSRVEASEYCLKWLDSQPSGTVVFLCFGSLGLFTANQLREIAVGLEGSGQRFLWVVRSPPTEDETQRFIAPPEPDLDALMPHGFLDRTKAKGLVLKSWAPQVSVLNHKSVGGFVTHCGWNSILEAVYAGVPMVAWPLYAEQRMNKTLLIEEMKLALPMNESKGGFVSAAEVEKRVKGLMESEEGQMLRENVKMKSEAAKAAIGKGGSSYKTLAGLAKSWKII